MDSYEARKFVLLIMFTILGLVFILRLFYIQVIDDSYKLSAKNQALRYVTQYPPRGLIYDRNHELLVFNEAAYDLMVVPRLVKNIDTLAFCELVGVSAESFVLKMQHAKKYSRIKASVFEKQINAEQFAAISEKLHKYPGFYGEKRTLRKYPDAAAAQILGYISEVNNADLQADNYYKKGDFIGTNGLEKSYEKELRGRRGQKVLVVDVHNRVKGSYENGKFDTLAIQGANLTSTIDKNLQIYGELLMQNKRGSIVAIEPQTGEILALVSAPSYDPNILAGRDRNVNFQMLLANDSLNPLFNRALNASYRPGSIFKLVQSLVGLQEKVIYPSTRFRCTRNIIACHGSHTNDDLPNAILHSCNPYFYNVYKKIIQPGKSNSVFQDSRIGLEIWEKHVRSFGLGSRMDIDLPNVAKGLVPNIAFYDKWYGANRWAFSTIYSNSIGEGELGVVPIQMANLAAIIANKGYYYSPHLVKSIDDSGKRPEYLQKNHTSIDEQYFQLVIDAMQNVVEVDGGTARRARIKDIEVCGKTGTVQNKDRPDHSVFIAFAPKENPQIAIAVYVEYAGFGGTWAAPIASLMIEKYLKGSIGDKEKEKRILDQEFLTIYAK